MQTLDLLLTTLFALLAPAAVVFALRRAIGNNRRWKGLEPELVADLEKRLGQKIVCTTMLNASDGPDFARERIFWLWLAFTSDRVAFAARDALARNGEGEIYVSNRSDATLERLDRHFAQLSFTEAETGRQAVFTVCVRPHDFDLLGRFIRRRN